MARQRRHQDHFGRRAKREGKAARSVFKLEEIDERWQILSAGDTVLDLGCAPGSWLQYAGTKVGLSGHVVGYDLKPLDVSFPAHVEVRQGDAFEITTDALPARLDVLLSDMAPSTMGDHTTDALRSAALVERALALAEKLLKPGGHTVLKVLEGGEVPGIIKAMRSGYTKVELLRPDATRKHSTEMFLIGLGKKA
ncbi:MAG: hypothetical protein A2289_18080 [Deltaproteobacteria bacterium RIFOXYA12_FULL_58_15]|nr:MAG: hypothetical protein A2289_18080 [Deltaproteobacteria bacterium RIFOXYA12_FULL_58_15]OGR13648.1 MAG: hypothetical protein A2341_22600 [Deltaproteobacteria bacterium RIFOXYB12_FULL_58_9]